MKKLDVGQTLQLLGNAGVVAGILLLVYELNQNRAMMQSQTRSAIAEQLSNLAFQEINTAGLPEAILKTETGESLTALENLLVQRRETAYWRYRENVHYQYRNGLYDDSEYLTQRAVWIRILNGNEFLHARWCSREGLLSQAFFDEINGLLDSPCR